MAHRHEDPVNGFAAMRHFALRCSKTAQKLGSSGGLAALTNVVMP